MCTHQDLFNNDKPWFSTKLKPLRQAKEDDYSSGEKALHKQAKYTLNEWRDKSGKEKLLCKAKKKVFKQRLYISVERPDSHHQLQDPTPSTEANQQLAEDLNEFYCRFESKSLVWLPTPTLTVSQNSHQYPPPYCFSACTKNLWRWCKKNLQETKIGLDTFKFFRYTYLEFDTCSWTILFFDTNFMKLVLTRLHYLKNVGFIFSACWHLYRLKASSPEPLHKGTKNIQHNKSVQII